MDFSARNAGSIVLLRPHNEIAKEWIDELIEHEPYQWLAGALAIEARYFAPIAEGLVADGFTLEEAP